MKIDLKNKRVKQTTKHSENDQDATNIYLQMKLFAFQQNEQSYWH